MSREVINMARGRPAKCPYCGGSSINKGFRKTKTMGKRRIKLCKACRRKFTPRNQSAPEAEAEDEGQAEQAAAVSSPPGGMAANSKASSQAPESPEPLLNALDQEWT